MIARGATAAAEFFELYEGFGPGDAEAQYVRVLPKGLDVSAVRYADEEALKRCGAELGRRGTVRICGRTYQAGDIVGTIFRALARQRREELRVARAGKRRAAI